MQFEKLAREQARELRKQYLAEYQAWDKTAAIKIKYVGSEVSATAQVKATTLELAAPALTVLENINMAAAAYDTLAELVAYINGLTDWECTLGDQFDGDEASVDLTVAGPTSVKTTLPVAFAFDANPQMMITIPADPEGSQIIFTGFVGKSTYGSGTSAIEIYDGDTLVWTEPAGASTVMKQALLQRYSLTEGNDLKVKVVNSAEMTAGEMSIAYELK